MKEQETRLPQREQAMEQRHALPEFWATVYGPGRGLLSLVSAVRAEPQAPLSRLRQAYLAWPANDGAAVRWVAEEVAQDREVYQCAHLLTRPQRRKEHAARLTCLYVDQDNPPAGGLTLEPTLTVESSPGRHQLYFQLTQAVDPVRGAALNKRLAAALGADMGGWDLTQLLRVPGSRNHKYASAPLVHVVDVRSVRYNPRELEAFLPPLAPPTLLAREPETPAPVTETASAEPPVKLTHSGRALWNGEAVPHTPDGRVDRSKALIQMARMLAPAHLAREHLAAILAERDQTLGWRKFADRDQPQGYYLQLVDLVARGTPTRQQPRP